MNLVVYYGLQCHQIRFINKLTLNNNIQTRVGLDLTISAPVHSHKLLLCIGPLAPALWSRTLGMRCRLGARLKDTKKSSESHSAGISGHILSKLI